MKTKLVILPDIFNCLIHNQVASFADNLLLVHLSQIYKQGIKPLPNRSLFVNLCGLIIGQKIRFKQAQMMRKKLYELMSGDDFNANDILVVDPDILEEITSATIAHRLLNLANYFSQHSQIDIDTLQEIEGVGIWTVKAAQLMSTYAGVSIEEMTRDEHVAILLHEDKVVMRQLKYCYPLLTKAQIVSSLAKFGKYQGLISWFLWRNC